MKTFLLILSILLLSSCSSPALEKEDIFFECYGKVVQSDFQAEEYYHFTVDGEDEDTVKQMVSMVNYFYANPVEKEVHDQVVTQQTTKYQGIEGVNYSHNYGTYGSQDKLEVDYTKVDMNELVNRNIIFSEDGAIPTFISYDFTTDSFPDSITCQAYTGSLTEQLMATTDLTYDMEQIKQDFDVVVNEGLEKTLKCSYTNEEYPSAINFHEFKYEESSGVVMTQLIHEEIPIGQGFDFETVQQDGEKNKAFYDALEGVTYDYVIDDVNNYYVSDLYFDYFNVNIAELVEAGIMNALPNGDLPTHVDINMTKASYQDGWVCE